MFYAMFFGIYSLSDEVNCNTTFMNLKLAQYLVEL
jgi:hypothetical protein